MKMSYVVALAVSGAGAAGAWAQTGVLYRLEPPSMLEQLRCTGPCLCPPHTVTGGLSGTFTLTVREVGPIFVIYRVTGVDWASTLGQEPVSIRGGGEYMTVDGSAVLHQMDLMLVASSPSSPDPVPYFGGPVEPDPQHPFPEIAITVRAPVQGCLQNTIRLLAKPVPCQADCDASGALSANDFACFLNKFAAGDPYANCDGSSVAPVLTANDFLCYLNGYAAGCP